MQQIALQHGLAWPAGAFVGTGRICGLADGAVAHAVPAIIIKAVAAHDGQLEVWGDGSPIREYTFSTDLAEATIWCFNNQEINTLLNIGSTEKITVKQCALEICSALDIDSNRLFFDSSKPNGRLIQNTSNTEFVSRSNFVYTKSSKMIHDTVKWYESALNNNVDFKR